MGHPKAVLEVAALEVAAWVVAVVLEALRKVVSEEEWAAQAHLVAPKRVVLAVEREALHLGVVRTLNHLAEMTSSVE